MSAVEAAPHAALMDATYRRQRFIYDATRKYFLLGRDELIAGLAPPPGGRVLEVACGTGRNLRAIGARYPGARLYGLDISAQMLRSARRTLGGAVVLAEADACVFDPVECFGVEAFDRIVLSYSLSMIPEWERALRHAVGRLAPGGQTHVVDFGRREGLPRWFGAGLDAWLARFHVTPRDELRTVAEAVAADAGATAAWRGLHRGYAQLCVIAKA